MTESATRPQTLRQPRRDGMRDLALRDFLSMNPDVVLETWTRDDFAVVDLLKVPEARRRQGLGSMAYAMWERTLPEGMEVQLYSVDAAAAAFWRTLGFTGADNGVMTKTVGPTTCPSPLNRAARSAIPS